MNATLFVSHFSFKVILVSNYHLFMLNQANSDCLPYKILRKVLRLYAAVTSVFFVEQLFTSFILSL